MMEDGEKRPIHTIALLLIGTLLLIGLFSQLTPPFEGPDEPEHFAYVTWLAAGRGFPPQGAAAWETDLRQEASQPPLYYLIASIPVRLVGNASPPAEYRPNPHYPSNAPGPIPDNKNIAIHYPDDSNPLTGGWLALSVARWASMLAGVILVAGVYGLTNELFPGNRSLAMSTALLVAITPQVLFISGVVSNDMLLAALSTLALWMLARLVMRPSSANGTAMAKSAMAKSAMAKSAMAKSAIDKSTIGRAIWLGVWLGLAAITKTSGLTLAIPTAIVLLGMLATRRWTLRKTMLTGGTTLGTFLLIAGWWYVRGAVLYGSPLGLDTHDYAPWADAGVTGVANFLLQWEEVFASYWAAFGWGNIKYDEWVYWLLSGLSLVAVAGLAKRVWAWRKQPPSAETVILLSALAAFAATTALALASWMLRVRAPHGRLLFPAIAAISLLLMLGWRAWHPRLSQMALLIVLGMMLLAPWRLLLPAYAWPELSAPNERVPEPVGWNFEDTAELLNVGVLERTAKAGGVLPIELCWEALSVPEQDLSQLVHLIGENYRLAAQRHTFPGLGSYPTSHWLVGQAFCDRVQVDIPADLPRTQLYQVEIGWFDPVSGERLTAIDANGVDVPSTYAGNVRLEAAGTSYTDAAPAVDGPMQLESAAFEKVWRAGESAEITLTWWLVEPLNQEYNTFVHLRDGGNVIAQFDGAPLDGWYPPNFWLARERVSDPRSFQLNSDIAPGEYDLVVGWYDFVTGQRLGSEFGLGRVEIIE